MSETATKKTCTQCGADLVWRDCGRCDGTGEIEDDDPINGPELMHCFDCCGVGEYLACEFCDEDEL